MPDRSHDDRFSDDRGGARTVAEPSGDRSGSRRVLLVGAERLADATERALEAGGASVVRLTDPRDPDIRGAFPYQGTVYLVDRDREIEPFVPVAAPAGR